MTTIATHHLTHRNFRDRPGFAGHPTDTPSTVEVTAATGATMRQLDFGYRDGSLLPEPGVRGSGSRLRWSRREVAVIARLMEVAAALPSTNFAELVRQYAPDLRTGVGVVVDGPWGLFVIQSVEP